MILRTIAEIDPGNPEFRALSDISFSFGLIDMTEVHLVASESFLAGEEKILQAGNIEINAVRLLLTCAIINFAKWKYGTFEIPLPSKDKDKYIIRHRRNYEAETHRVKAEDFFFQALEIINTYKLYEPQTNGAQEAK